MKLFKLIVLNLISFSFLLSCSSEEGNKGADKNITLSVWMDNNEKEMEFLKKVSHNYHKEHPDIKIDFEFANFIDLKPKFIGNRDASKNPDIIFVVNDWIGELAEKELIREIKGDRQYFIDKTVDSLKYHNKLFVLPRNYELVGLFYNKTLINKAPETVSEMIDIATKLKKEKKLYGLMYDNTNFYYHAPWFYGFGGKLFDLKGEISLSDLKNNESFQFVLDLKNKYGVLPEKSNQYAMINMFCSGQIAMIITGPWSLAEINQNKIDYGIAPLPVISEGKPLKPFIGVKGYAVTTGSKHPQEAEDFAEYLTSEEVQKMAVNELGILPTIKSLYEENKIPTELNAFYKQVKNGTLMPSYPEMKYVWQEYNWALSRIFSSGEPVEAVLDKAAKQIYTNIKADKKL